tara:strand:+ start:137 stop:469 length:333 start_codon:yes stop_codon:yes gene_type:complete
MVEITTVPGKYGPNDVIVLVNGEARTYVDVQKEIALYDKNEDRRYNKGDALGSWVHRAWSTYCSEHDINVALDKMSKDLQSHIRTLAREFRDTYWAHEKRASDSENDFTI